jgi:hypothetical protein
MELGMAAMLSPVQPPIPATTWALMSGVFAAGTLMVSGRRRAGGRAFGPGCIAGARDRAHLAMLSVSMVFMVVDGSAGPSSAHHHVATAGGQTLPTPAATPAVAAGTAGVDVDRLTASAGGAPPMLAWLLASYFVLYALLSATHRLNRQPIPPAAALPAVEHGSRPAGYRMTRAAQPSAVKPALLTGCDVAMSAAMAYMLLTMP